MPNPAKSFTDLVVWQKAHEFVLQLYRFTERFPRAEIFALTAQMRRAAVSIPRTFQKVLASARRLKSFAFSTLPRDQLKRVNIT
jgi:23S rRNA-intervening sequence protein